MDLAASFRDHSCLNPASAVKDGEELSDKESMTEEEDESREDWSGEEEEEFAGTLWARRIQDEAAYAKKVHYKIQKSRDSRRGPLQRALLHPRPQELRERIRMSGHSNNTHHVLHLHVYVKHPPQTLLRLVWNDSRSARGNS